MAISMRLSEATDGRSIDRRRAVSERLFDTSESIFYVRDSTRRCYEDEIDLRWAALEKLPTYDRLKVAFVPRENSGSAHVFHEQVDIRNIDPAVRQELLDRLVHIVGDDNESFVQKLRDRIDRVGIKLPEIEVRYEHLSVNTEVYQEGRALRTLANFTLWRSSATLSGHSMLGKICMMHFLFHTTNPIVIQLLLLKRNMGSQK